MIHIANRQKKVRIPAPKVRALVKRVLRGEGAGGMKLSLVFVDNRVIRSVNRRFLRKNSSTDVIAFRYREDVGPDQFDGEIIISAEYARLEAGRRDIPIGEELLRYVAHGVLHVLGYDDTTSAKKKKMWAKQEKYLKP